jgi:hypothetical protein
MTRTVELINITMARTRKKTSKQMRISRNVGCAILHRQFLLKSLRCSAKYEKAEYAGCFNCAAFYQVGNFELVLEEAPLYLVWMWNIGLATPGRIRFSLSVYRGCAITFIILFCLSIIIM